MIDENPVVDDLTFVARVILGTVTPNNPTLAFWISAVVDTERFGIDYDTFLDDHRERYPTWNHYPDDVYFKHRETLAKSKDVKDRLDYHLMLLAHELSFRPDPPDDGYRSRVVGRIKDLMVDQRDNFNYLLVLISNRDDQDRKMYEETIAERDAEQLQTS